MHISTGDNFGDLRLLINKKAQMMPTPDASEVYQQIIQTEREDNPALLNDEDVIQKDACKMQIRSLRESFGPDVFDIALEELREEI